DAEKRAEVDALDIPRDVHVPAHADDLEHAGRGHRLEYAVAGVAVGVGRADHADGLLAGGNNLAAHLRDTRHRGGLEPRPQNVLTLEGAGGEPRRLEAAAVVDRREESARLEALGDDH